MFVCLFGAYFFLLFFTSFKLISFHFICISIQYLGDVSIAEKFTMVLFRWCSFICCQIKHRADGTVSLRSVGRLFVHLTVLSIYSVMIYILIAPISCIYNNISAYVSHNARDTHTRHSPNQIIRHTFYTILIELIRGFSLFQSSFFFVAAASFFFLSL